MSSQTTLWDLLNATSSQALVAGPTRSDSQDGMTADPSGLDLAPASLSPSQVEGRQIAPPAEATARTRGKRQGRGRASTAATSGPETHGYSGPSFDALSPSARLQSSLVSRLRVLLDGAGSPLYDLTWKAWDMQSGPPICALRASGRRISDSGCIGWPTAMAQDESRGGTDPRPQDTGIPLSQMAALAGWPIGWSTPTTRDYRHANALPWSERGGGKKGEQLNNQVVHLAGWPTSKASDGKKGARSSDGAIKQAMRTSGPDLPTIAAITEPMRCTQAGVMLTGLDAGMTGGGQLHPEHSRWLMGYPAGWGSCGATAMRSNRKSPKSGSARSI
jgi:hypothetical protein